MIKPLPWLFIAAVPWLAGGPIVTSARADDVQVNTYTSGEQRSSSVAMGPDGVASYQGFPSVALGPYGDFVIAWHSDGSGGTDVSGTSIQKTPAALIFADGFESGDTSAW